MAQPGDDARALLLARASGVLSTLSVDCPGYPFGSLTPYCLGRDGSPLLHVSRIAQHTKNLAADGRASLTVVERGDGDVQAGARVTVLADAELLDEAEPRDADDAARYRRFVPAADDHERAHAFRFVRLVPHRVRFIGGFGRIHWLPPGDVFVANPFGDADERRVVDHMNEDHADALALYAERLCGAADGTGCRMAGIDREGFHMLLGDKTLRVAFEGPVLDAGSARAALVALLKTAREEGPARAR